MRALSMNREKMLVFAAALLLFACKAAFIGSTPVRSLGMTQWIIDDSFIVMRIARNIALGHGFSFDTLHPTTGVSFLWTYLTSLTHLLFTKDGAVKATLILSTFFGSVSTLAVFRIARTTTGSAAIAWTAFALASLLAVPFFNAMNGMETAFFSLCVICAIGAFINACTAHHDTRQGIIAGVWAGLSLLTRADGIFLVMALTTGYAVRWIRGDRQTRRSIVREALAFAGIVALSLVILLGWQMWLTGSPLPANQVGRRGIEMDKHNFSYADFSLPHYLAIVAWNTFNLEALVTLSLTSGILALVAVFHGLFMQRLRAFTIVTTLYVLLFAGALVAYQWYFPDYHGLRYLNAAIHLLAIPLAALLWALPANRWKPAAVICIVLVMTGISWYRFVDYARRPDWAKGMHVFSRPTAEAQTEFWAAIDWVRANVPEDSVIAVRDHGRMSFFSDRKVQDIAGILDPDLIVHWKDGTLTEYLQERGVTYAFLPPPDPAKKTIYQGMHEALDWTPVPGAPAQDQTGFALWRKK